MKPIAFDFQKGVMKDIDSFDGRCLMALEMGLGKTLTSLWWLEKDKQNRLPAVVVCPASIKYQWEHEALSVLGWSSSIAEGQKPPKSDPGKSKLVIINYDILSYWVLWLRKLKPKTVIIDECFPWNTLIHTNKGWLPIGSVVDEKLDVLVSSYDFHRSAVVFRPILHYYKKIRTNRMVQVIHSYGSISCTENHKIWTENRGYVKAKNLLHDDCLRMVWGRKTSQKSRENDGKVLQQKLFQQTQQQTTGDVSNQGSQRHLAYLERQERRQRANHFSTTNTLGSVGRRLGIRIGDNNRRKAKRGFTLSIQLQSGYWEQGKNGSNRSRWKRPSKQTKKNIGSKEAKSDNISWVESVQIYESGNRFQCNGSKKDHSFVYNIEVEEHHNYYANGILVSNCQKIMNLKTRRTKAVRQLCRQVPNVLALSGTPMINRPIELFPTLNLLRPNEFSSRWSFGHDFCGARKTQWGWEFKGSTNRKELNRLLTTSCMSRLRKSEVLKDLPPKMRQVVPMKLKNEEEYQRANDDFLNWLWEQDPSKARRAANAESLTKIGHLLRLTAKLKFWSVKEWIDQFLESDQKLIVFCQHRKMIDGLKRRIETKSVIIDGRVTGRKRHAAVQQFQNDKKTRLLIGNMKAAGIGLNLTAASNVAFAELGWVPGEHTQAEDRAHRIGQTDTVWAHYLVARNTIEARLCEVIQKKQGVVSDILDGRRLSTDLDVYNRLIGGLLYLNKEN